MFHKEGHTIIITSIFISMLLLLTVNHFLAQGWLRNTLFAVIVVFLGLILQFFRNPKRNTVIDPQTIVAPVDGKVVIVKEVYEGEYFKDHRLQVSIFMSPINVHVTRYALSGKVIFSKYHPGKYLVAWHPKSSTLNERTTVVIENKTFGAVLYRQIAGLLARRIVNYAKVGDKVVQGTDAGFIKFGSRVDLFLPLDTAIKVAVGQTVKGGEEVIATKNKPDEE